jgi:hypothetical protein
VSVYLGTVERRGPELSKASGGRVEENCEISHSVSQTYASICEGVTSELRDGNA